MIAIQALWTEPSRSSADQDDWLPPDFEWLSAVLSAVLWRRHQGTPIRLYTDARALKFLRFLQIEGVWDGGIDVTTLNSISSLIDPKVFWAAGKIAALEKAPVPCALLDLDFFVWQSIPVSSLYQPLLVAHLEPLSSDLYPPASALPWPVGYRIPSKWDWRVQPANTAFVYISDVALRDAYVSSALSYMRGTPRHSNPIVPMIFAEQRMLAMVAAERAVPVATLLDTADAFDSADVGFTHLWGAKQLLRESPIAAFSYCRACLSIILRLEPSFAQSEGGRIATARYGVWKDEVRTARERLNNILLLVEAKRRQDEIDKKESFEREERARLAALDVRLRAIPGNFATPGTKPGDRMELTLPGGVKMAFRWCPAGIFMMGSSENEAERLSNEGPVQVRLTKGFWMAETPVTQGQYQAVMGSNPSHFGDLVETVGGFLGLGGTKIVKVRRTDLPVENVSWDDAHLFCHRFSAVTALKGVLPTEAQWEYACRAGTTTRFHFGTTITPEQVNYDDNQSSSNATKGLYRQKTTPAGSFPANAWGLGDMHGNVWEWCSDLYEWSLPGGTDPTGPSSGSSRVFRGGSWYHCAQFCRSTTRLYDNPANRRNYVGFRPVLPFDWRGST